jgi:hypothetical protein
MVFLVKNSIRHEPHLYELLSNPAYIFTASKLICLKQRARKERKSEVQSGE